MDRRSSPPLLRGGGQPAPAQCHDAQVFAVPMREGRAAARAAARPVQSDASVARFSGNCGDQVLQQERSLHFKVYT